MSKAANSEINNNQEAIVMTNAITRVEIEDFLVFKGKFSMDFCHGVNVLIGGNGTGKTTLMRVLYNPFAVARSKMVESQWTGDKTNLAYLGSSAMSTTVKKLAVTFNESVVDIAKTQLAEVKQVIGNKQAVYIPEKDILEHAKGLLTFIEQKQTGFSQIYKDVLVNAQDIPTQKQSETQAEIGTMIADKIGGTVQWDKGDGSFYTLRTDGTRIPFANEASGFKKLGFLGLLVTCGQLAPDSVLLWDEPENSLNPELIPFLVEILLKLSRNGVQIFVATHSELLANEFSISQKDDDCVKFFSLYKGVDGAITANTDTRFDLLEPNKLTQASVEQYEREIERGLGGND
jgi:predicted ATPase